MQAVDAAAADPDVAPAHAWPTPASPRSPDATGPGTTHATQAPADAATAASEAAARPAAPARLYGEPLLQLPPDLYIPPDALQVLLEAFEGPLDLLLYLIRKQSFDILDIPMAEVTRQYLAYVERIRAANLELAAEYLLMAALLIDIKSRMLLPRPRAQPDAEPEDPRAELARRLVEYERFRLAAQALDALPQVGRDVLPVRAHDERPAPARLAGIEADDLRRAWEEVLRRAQLTARHQVAREALSVREHMTAVLRSLRERPFAEFGELFDAARGVAYVVVTFVALLELAREALVEITQAAAFAPIYVRLTPEREPQPDSQPGSGLQPQLRSQSWSPQPTPEHALRSVPGEAVSDAAQRVRSPS